MSNYFQSYIGQDILHTQSAFGYNPDWFSSRRFTIIAVHLDRVSVNYGTGPVFENLSWEIHNDRVVGLIGPNGSGKSTLLHLIAGYLSTDTGFVKLSSGLSFGILHQEPRLDLEKTVLAETLTASPELAEVEIELSRVETKLSDPDVFGDEKQLARTLDQQAKLLAQYEELGGAYYQNRVRGALKGLGIDQSEFDLKIKNLSGGQKKMVELAKLIVNQPSVLLLDEPDNHLDLAGKSFLEKFIRSYKGAVVLISHDRYLLDLVVDEIAEIEDGRLATYPGNYSEYTVEKQARLLRQQQIYQAHQKEVDRLQQSAKRLLLWGKVHDNEKFVRRGKNILKRIERMDKVDRPVLDRRRMDLEISGWRGSNKVLEVIQLAKSFELKEGEEHRVLDGLEMQLWHGEKVGLVGPNGAGKSVYFDLLLEKLIPDAGEIKIGPSIEVGYYAQEHETLDYERTLIDTIRYAAPLSENAAVSFLGKFLFDYDQARGQVKNLSGGERSRLQMALLMLSKANFLLLDEPTNNLDIASAEVLEDALDSFEGSVLVISHDRYFLDRIVDRIVELDAGKLTEYLGDYSDYLNSKNQAKTLAQD
ncbi:MAG: ribosomal protection-like ABC-F family protein [Chloroflexota bacterium]